MTRVNKLLKNAKWSYIGSFASIVTGFISRTAFIYILGTTYLGLNTVFTSVLGILSFAELGIGNVLNTQLYKPVAENNHEKIKTLINLYRKAYLIIASGIAVIGLAFLPFLNYVIKGAVDIPYVKIYYLVFLFNTVISYFVSYKYSLPNAEQKIYIQTNITTVFSIISIMIQIITIILFRTYWIYLAAQTIVVIVQCLFASIYLDKKYPIFSEKNIKPLQKKEKDEFKNNLSAGVMYKLSDVAINQTDNLIISGMINVETVGLMSNYTMLLTYVEKLTKPILDNTGPGLGDFIATESIERKRDLIKIYQFLGFWINCFCAIGLITLSSPLIKLWLGSDKVLPIITIIIYFINFFYSGLMRAFSSMKAAHGIFYDDWYVGIIAAIVNLVVSIILVHFYGLPGVFIGTLASNIVSEIGRPIISYRKHYHEPLIKYFLRNTKYLIVGICTGIIVFFVTRPILAIVSIPNFIMALGIVVIIPNLIWILIFHRTMEYRYFYNVLKKISLNIFKRSAEKN